jgi:hypothetical protein
MWQRFMARLLKETKIIERFTEHDLRGKVGSDAESLEREFSLRDRQRVTASLRKDLSVKAVSPSAMARVKRNAL